MPEHWDFPIHCAGSGVPIGLFRQENSAVRHAYRVANAGKAPAPAYPPAAVAHAPVVRRHHLFKVAPARQTTAPRATKATTDHVATAASTGSRCDWVRGRVLAVKSKTRHLFIFISLLSIRVNQKSSANIRTIYFFYSWRSVICLLALAIGLSFGAISGADERT